MDPADRKLTIKTLQERLAQLKFACDGFSKELNQESSNPAQQALVANQWDAALKERRALQFVLDSLELEEQKETPRS